MPEPKEKLLSNETLDKLSPELRARFGFLAEYLPRFVPQIDVNDRTRYDPILHEAFASYMEACYKDGLLETTQDAVDAGKIFFMDVAGLEFSGVVLTQVGRFKKDIAGSLLAKEVFGAEKLMSAWQRLTKMAMESKEAAGFSRRVRAEMGLGSANSFETMLQQVGNAGDIDAGSDVSIFLLGGRPRRVNENQLGLPESEDAVFEDVNEKMISEADAEFLHSKE